MTTQPPVTTLSRHRHPVNVETQTAILKGLVNRELDAMPSEQVLGELMELANNLATAYTQRLVVVELTFWLRQRHVNIPSEAL